MLITWIVVANDEQAKIFVSHGPEDEIETGRRMDRRNVQIERAENADELDPRSPPPPPHETEEEKRTRVFCKAVAVAIESGRSNGRYDQIVLIAPPDFMGRLRKMLVDVTLAKVVASLQKDLADTDGEALREMLKDQVAV